VITAITGFKSSILREFSKKQVGKAGSGDGELKNPCWIAIDPNNQNIIVTDTGNKRIQVFDTDGNFVLKFGSQDDEATEDGKFYFLSGIAVDKNGDIITVDDSSRVQVFDSKGNFKFKFGTKGKNPGEMYGVEGVGVDGEGNIVVAEKDTNRVSIFNKEGKFLKCVGAEELDSPVGVAIDGHGNIAVAEYSSSRLQVFGPK